MDRTTQLLQKACNATSLVDFGEDSFREGLDVFTASAAAEGRLTEMGQAAIEAQLVGFLSCRLQVEDWYRRHPEIDEQEIKLPLIGLGLPRTGSTALSCLLAEDPAVRSIRGWEAAAPCPPPETATEHTDPRIEKARQSMIQRSQRFPRMQMMLPSTATSPTECLNFMAYDFKSHLFQAFAQIPTYTEWLHYKADMVPTYRYVRRVLKLLQWRCPPTRWRLKSPAHIIFIESLTTVFPDARFVMTHRDIASVIPSAADVYFELIRAFSNDVDKAYIGELNASVWELGMRRLIAFRDGGHDHRFFDIHFAPFQKDPFPVLQQLYDFLGEKFTAETRARMEKWRRETPREKHGDHQYDAADFGLDIRRLRERFRFYAERFNVETPA